MGSLDGENYLLSQRKQNGTEIKECQNESRTKNYVSNSPKNKDYYDYLDSKPHAKLVGIKGAWYDVTEFLPHHPGGPVLGQFIGKDATAVFSGFHERNVLLHRSKVGQYSRDFRDPAAKIFADLHERLKQNGFFQTSMTWYFMKICFATALLLLSICCVALHSAFWVHLVGAVFLAAFWQQCGFFMHDFMHNQVFHNRVWDQRFGTFFGTVCFGISGLWWRDEHFVHHALVNTVDKAENFADPQMREDVWAQDRLLFPYFNTKFHAVCVRFQHVTFLPVCVFLGRLGIVIDSFSHEKRIREWCAGAFHWLWIGALLRLLPTWSEVFWFYFTAATVEGILHIQLLISHYCKPWHEHGETSDQINWYRKQIVSNINITCPVWLDWFHGGLNFHIEHHLYPTMPRHNYRRASAHVREACVRAGLEYDECTWSEAVIRTIQHLKKTSIHYSLDPR